MSPPVHVSNVRIERRSEPLRIAHLPGESQPVVEIESDQGVLVIRRVHVHYLLDGADQVTEIVERVHRVYADKCPVYKTLRSAFEITSDFELKGTTATGGTQ
jgi:hypothetical protein